MVPRSLRYPMQTLLRLHGVNFGKRQLGRRRMFEKGLTQLLGVDPPLSRSPKRLFKHPLGRLYCESFIY
jgi:hypothetical protein